MPLLTFFVRDRSGNRGRTSMHVRPLSLSAANTYAATIAPAIAALSDAVVYKMTLSYSAKLISYVNDDNLSGTFDRNGLFLGTDENDNISSILIPSIRPSMMKSNGTMAGVELSEEALSIINTLNTGIVLYNQFGLPITQFSIGGVTQ